jgi:hypothetical protein
VSDVYDLAWSILAGHVGHKNAIKSADLSRMLKVGDDRRGTRETRAIVLEILRRGLPVGATEEGYFVLENENERDEYVRELNDRIVGIQHRGLLVVRAFASYKTGATTEAPIHWSPEPEER